MKPCVKIRTQEWKWQLAHPDPKQQIKRNGNSSLYASPVHIPNFNPSKDNRRLISLLSNIIKIKTFLSLHLQVKQT